MKKAPTLASIFAITLLALAGAILTDTSQANPYSNAGEVPPKSDTTPPKISIFSPTNNSKYTGDNFTVTLDFSITQPSGPTVDHPFLEEISYNSDWHPNNITLYGRKDWYPFGGFQCTEYSDKINFTNLAEGKHNITIYATYNGRYIPGNNNNTLSLNTFKISSSSTVCFTVDDLKDPILMVISVENKIYNQTDVPLIFRIFGSVLQTTYSLDGKANVSVAGNTTLTGLSYGTHILTAYPTDAAGNDGAPKTVTFLVVDKVTPKIAILSIEKNRTYLSSLDLNFTINESTSQLSYVLDGQQNASLTGNTTLSGLTNGNHNITIYAADGAGNIGVSETVVFSVSGPEFSPIALGLALFGASTAAIAAGLLVYSKKRQTRLKG